VGLRANLGTGFGLCFEDGSKIGVLMGFGGEEEFIDKRGFGAVKNGSCLFVDMWDKTWRK